jgi:6-phosphogluconolactonase
MIKIFKDQKAASREMAEAISSIAEEAVAREGRFTIALTGGSSPQTLYEILRSDPHRQRIPWQNGYFFWGDERAVQFDDDRNNAKMTFEKLLNHVPVPADQIYRMNGEAAPEKAAEEYEILLKRHFGEQEPAFDLILLGMGVDGHTASIFPGSVAVHEKNRLVTTGYNSEQSTQRITLTAPLINKARHIFFAVFGDDKAETLRQVLEGEYNPEKLPVQLVKSGQSEITWFLDDKSAKLLKNLSE